MIAPTRAILALGLLTTASVCPFEPTPTEPPTQTPWYGDTPTPWDGHTPTPYVAKPLDFNPTEDASIICDERGWHITMRVVGGTMTNPPAVFGMYDIPSGEEEPVYNELHPIVEIDTFVEPYYDILYLDLAFADPGTPQVDGETSEFDCRKEEVLSFQLCSFDYHYEEAPASCWAWGLAPQSVPRPQSY